MKWVGKGQRFLQGTDRDMNFRSNIDQTPRLAGSLINFIDILLVLVVFLIMTTAPGLNRNKNEIDLPSTEGQGQIQGRQQSLVLTIGIDGHLDLDGKSMTSTDDLKDTLQRIQKLEKNTSVTINADRKVEYEIMLRALDACQKAGVTRIGFASKPIER